MTHPYSGPAGGPERLARWFTEAGRQLDGADDPPAVARAAVDVVVPALADLAVVGATGAAPAIAATGETVFRDAERLLEAAPDLIAQLGAALARERPPRWRWLHEIDDAALRALGAAVPAFPPFLTGLGVTSLITLPLTARGRQYGVIVLGCRGPGRLGAAELGAAQVLARRAGLALERAVTDDAALPNAARHTRMLEAERRWMHLFEHATCGAGILDAADLRFDAVNPALAAIHGYESPGALLGRPVTDLIPGESAGELGPRLREGTSAPVSYEAYHLRGPGGRDGRVPVLVTLTPIPEPAGLPTSVTLQVQDLTHLRRTEERLERAQRLEAVGRLAGGVAHEVNNMMTVVLGFADLMLAAGDLTEAHRQEAIEIRRAGARVGAITRQLLAFSRRQLLQPEVLDLNEVVEGAAQLLRPLLPADVTLELETGDPGDGVLADRVQLEQVLVNLAFNARDAMPAGGRICVRVGRYHQAEDDRGPIPDVEIPPGEYGTIEVADTGVGMDHETLGRIFEPFFTTKEVGVGTGLGLATVYGIVKQSGGYVWARSRPGAGSSFTVSLPLVPAGPAEGPEPAGYGAFGEGTETILVVEDEEAVRALAARILTTSGFRVLLAGDGVEALEVLDADRGGIDLVLTDLVMPDMGGRPLRDRIRELAPGMPVVYMSGYASEEALGRGWLDPDDPLLQKPFTPDDLIRAVRHALDARRVVND